MTMNNHGPIAAGLLIPTHVPVVLSKPRTQICCKCGSGLPQGFPWAVCDACRLHIAPLKADVPVVGQTPGINQDMGNLGQSMQRQIFSVCVSCQMPIEVPRVNSPLYRDLICTACRMRQEDTKLKSTRRINPIPTTAHPRLLPPFPDTRPPIRVPSYPSFFNSRGELVAPPPPRVIVPIVTPHMMPDVSPVCMRFGCGMRLGPNQKFNFCGECLRLGFGRGVPTPPPPVKHHQKRIKRHDLPLAASLWNAKRDIETARGAETLVQAPCGESPEVGAGNDDLDLELIYPEDEAPAVQNYPDSAKKVDDVGPHPERTSEPGRSLPSPQTPTTIIPPPISPPPKRTCETPGCGGIVSPSATWQRCYQCSLRRWKERQQAAIAASAAVGPASPAVSEHELEFGEVMNDHAPASVEPNVLVDRRREPGTVSPHPPAVVSGAVDKLSPLRLPNGQNNTNTGVATGTSGTLYPQCGSDTGVERESIPGLDGGLMDLSAEDEGVPERDSKSDAKDSFVIKIRIPVLASRLLNLRVFAIKRCNIALPPDNRGEICDSCRRYQWRRQRERMEKAHRRMQEFLQIGHEPGDILETDTRLPEVNDEKTPEDLRLCAVPRCRARLPESNYHWIYCQTCRKRARNDARRSSAGILVDFEDLVENSSSSDTSPYPTFQNRSVLLSEFSARLEQFLENRILYLRAKLQTVGETALSKLDLIAFAFVGEYSEVTSQREHRDIDRAGKSDPEKNQVEVQEEIASVVEEFNSALFTEFKLLESSTISSCGVTVRYNSDIEMPFRPLQNAKDTDAAMPLEGHTSSSHVPHLKQMSGELEITVVPDDSHYLLSGRRTIIRLHLLG